MIGKIFINGLIGSIGNEKGVELIDVIQQVKKQPLAESFDVFINSEGGVVTTGFDIYDYLNSLGKPVTTIASGLCASIATVIYMSGDKRILRPDCQFMIHLPMVSSDYMNSEEMQFEIEELKKLENKLVSFYKKTANVEKEEVYPLMRNETFLTPEQALNLGFVTEIKEKEFTKAVAYINNKSKTEIKMSETKLSQEDKNWFEKTFANIARAFDAKKVNLILQDATGVEINFEALTEEEAPSVGDSATIEGVPAEGSYEMPSLGGVTVVFLEGVVTEIIEPSEDGETEEMAALKARNEELEAMNQELNVTLKDNEVKLNELKDKFVNFKRQIVSKFELDSVKRKEADFKEVESEATKRLNKLKNKR